MLVNSCIRDFKRYKVEFDTGEATSDACVKHSIAKQAKQMHCCKDVLT